MTTPGLPRFSNPHHLIQDSELVSRASLLEDGLISGLEGFAASGEYVEEIRSLESLVKENLGDVSERPRKRRKTEKKRDVEATEAIEALGDVATLAESNETHQAIVSSFRLLGSTLPPRPICLNPPPVPERIVWEPPCEDTDLEAEERASKAASIAVDFDWLIAESSKSYVHRPNEERKVFSARAPIPADSPPLFLLEGPKSISSPTLASTSTPAEQEPQPHHLARSFKPSPHEPRPHSSSCPSVQITDTNSAIPAFLPSSARKRLYHSQSHSHNPSSSVSTANAVVHMNNIKHHHRQHKPARFWRPMYGWGGKSLGYAMGYEGSWAIDEEDARDEGIRGYRRDKMKKGVYGEVWGSGLDSGWQ